MLPDNYASAGRNLSAFERAAGLWRDHLIAGIVFDELRVVTIGNEAYLLALGLLSGIEAEGSCDFADLRLGHFAEGKDGARELLLGHFEQKVGLVFGEVPPFLQNEPLTLVVIFDPGIVASSDTLGADLLRQNHESRKLQLRIAGDAGNRS